MTEQEIEQFLSLKGYDTEIRKKRRKKSEINSNEFFTPYSIVKKMADKIADEDWADPNKTFLEPCFGNGQFVCYIIWRRITAGVDYLTVIKTLYGVELMEDNVNETKNRIFDLLTKMGITYYPEEVKHILDHNLVCSDFFAWDFENWCPLNKKLF